MPKSKHPISPDEIQIIRPLLVAAYVSCLFCCPLGLLATCFAWIAVDDLDEENYKRAKFRGEVALILTLLAYIAPLIALVVTYFPDIKKAVLHQP